MVTASCRSRLLDEALRRQNLPERFLSGNLEAAPSMTRFQGRGQ